MIGKMPDLINAANGVFQQRQIPAVGQNTGSDAPSPFQQAANRRRELAITSADRMSLSGYTPPGLQQELTPTFEKLLSTYRPSTAGLSAKGKYGGFMTSADRDAAISGAAMQLSTEAPARLRELAGQRYSDVEKLYLPATRAAAQPLLQEAAARGGGRMSPREFEELSQLRVPESRQSSYGRKLAEWYAGNLKPAEEYLATAQQFEATPVSDLATSIASRSYGMNPQLARGKFAGLDKTLFEEERNRQSMQKTGMGYEESQWRKQQNLDLLKEQSKSQVAYVEASTGMDISQIRNASGLNDEAIYSALARPSVVIDGDGQQVAYSPADLVSEAMGFLQQNDQKKLNQLIDSVRQQPGQEDVATLILAIVGLQGRKATRSLDWLAQYDIANR